MPGTQFLCLSDFCFSLLQPGMLIPTKFSSMGREHMCSLLEIFLLVCSGIELCVDTARVGMVNSKFQCTALSGEISQLSGQQVTRADV